MTRDEWARAAWRISAIWATELSKPWLEETYAILEPLDYRDVMAAVVRLGREGTEFLPKAPSLYKAAKLAETDRLRVENFGRSALPEPKATKELEAFAARQNGYSPSQVGKLLAGLDPGPPAFPALHDPSIAPAAVAAAQAKKYGVPVDRVEDGSFRPDRGGQSAAHPDPA